jgi:hypothetical protein
MLKGTVDQPTTAVSSENDTVQEERTEGSENDTVQEERTEGSENDTVQEERTEGSDEQEQEAPKRGRKKG